MTRSTRLLVDHAGGQRPEIQALRAFAVLAVVLNHLWPGRVQGGFVGVDVFFVISGFLITSHLLREATSTGTIRLGAFWARRARRLLPASLVVLAACALGVIALVPMGQWQSALIQIAASAVYIVNWVLLAQSVDYFTSAAAPSPVTHFWSLSVEEQFYIVWPVLVLVALFVIRSRQRRALAVGAVLTAVTIASFVFSITATSQDPSAAYFSTLTRAWEFGVGGVLAVLLNGRILGGRVAVWASWAGWALLAASLVVIDEATPFPGIAALLPVAATALVIAAGSALRENLSSVSGFAPVRFFGDISYSLYLWHWPLIILVPFALGREVGDVCRGAILVIAILLAWLSKRFIEDPFRTRSALVRRPPWVTLVATATATALVAGTALIPVAIVDSRRQAMDVQLSALAFAGEPCFGADGMAAGCDDSHVLAYPDALLATNAQQGGIVPGVDETCSTDPERPRVNTCVMTPSTGAITRTVTLVGDSHALHYVAALRKLVSEDGWRVKSVVQPGCMPIAFDPDIVALWDPSTAPGCREWADQAIEHVAADDDSGVVIFSSISREYGYADGSDAATQDISPSYLVTWQPWLDKGKKLVVMADTAFLQRGDILACLGRSGGSDAACSNDRGLVFAKPDPMVVAAETLSSADAAVFDANDLICDAVTCHAVVGGIPVYVDHNHLLQAFAMTLAEPIADAVTRMAPS